MIGLVSTDSSGQMTGKHNPLNKSTNPSSSVHTSTPTKPPTKPLRLIRCSQLHPKTHNHPEEKRRVTIIRKRKTLLSSQAPRHKKTMLRVNLNERPNIPA
jgi:hypothetical protein